MALFKYLKQENGSASTHSQCLWWRNMLWGATTKFKFHQCFFHSRFGAKPPNLQTTNTWLYSMLGPKGVQMILTQNWIWNRCTAKIAAQWISLFRGYGWVEFWLHHQVDKSLWLVKNLVKTTIQKCLMQGKQHMRTKYTLLTPVQFATFIFQMEPTTGICTT